MQSSQAICNTFSSSILPLVRKKIASYYYPLNLPARTKWSMECPALTLYYSKDNLLTHTYIVVNSNLDYKSLWQTIVTSSSPDFHCKGLELKDNEMLYVPGPSNSFKVSWEKCTCTLLCEGTMRYLKLVQCSVLPSLFFSGILGFGYFGLGFFFGVCLVWFVILGWGFLRFTEDFPSFSLFHSF